MTTSEHPASPLAVSPLAHAFGAALPTLPVDEAPFPRIAADLYGNGWPWYPMRVVPGEVPSWRATPTLPVGFVWADETDPIDTDEFVVLDLETVTELLYGAPLARGRHSRTELAQAVEGRLYAYRCRVETRPDHNAPEHLVRCRTWAAELIGGDA